MGPGCFLKRLAGVVERPGRLLGGLGGFSGHLGINGEVFWDIE